MTPEEFRQQMEDAARDHAGDTEVLHARMDTNMAELLMSLGYGEGIKVFDRCDKWYA
jgi:hypothetical protein